MENAQKEGVKTMEFQVNDTVLYCSHSVCKIEEISEQEFNGKKLQYYVLKPVYDKNSTIFVPVHNPVLTAKMRPILSAEKIYALIQSMPNEPLIWVEDENLRKERYKAIIANGNCEELVALIRTIYLHQQAQKEKGKKLHVSDEHFLKDAEKMLHDEFAYVLKIKPDQVLPFIMKQIKIAEQASAK